MNADDLATALTTGARAGWCCRSPRSCPSCGRSRWRCTSPGRTSSGSSQRLTLRFGGDVWWLSYVLIRDGLLVITLGLSLIFLFPNLYLKVGLPDHRAARDGGPVLGAGRQAPPGLRRRTRATFRLVSILLVIASVLYIVPQVYGLEAADQAYLGDLPNALTSTGNLALARPILWLSMGLLGVTSFALFARFLIRLGRPADGEETIASPEVEARAA